MEYEIKIKNGELTINEQAKELLIQARELDLYQKKIEVQLDALKSALKNAMEEAGVKSFENDVVKVVYKSEGTRQVVDTSRLKEDGLYDLYSKTSKVRSSVSLAFKE